jgi:hypothetical protein
MNASVDPDAALQALTDRLVPDIADLAGVYVIAAAHRRAGRPRPRRQSPSHSAPTCSPPPDRRPPPSPRKAPPRGTPRWPPGARSSSMSPASPRRGPSPPAPSGSRPLAAHSVAVVPLVVAGELAGALLLLAAGTRPRYLQSDVAFPRGRDGSRRRRGGAPAQLSAAAPDRPEPAAGPAAEHAADPAGLRRGRPVRRREQRRRGRRRLVGRPPPRRRTDRHRGG